MQCRFLITNRCGIDARRNLYKPGGQIRAAQPIRDSGGPIVTQELVDRCDRGAFFEGQVLRGA